MAPHAAAILRRQGFDAVHAFPRLEWIAPKTLTFWNSLEMTRVCVMLDHDFHAHLATTGQGRPSVILVRVQGLDAMGQAALIRSVYLQCEGVLSEGAAISADIESVRIRRLPLK